MGSLCASKTAAVPLPARKNAVAHPEESKILKNEQLLPFATLKAIEIVKSIKAEAADNTISLPQLKRAFHDLKISTEVFSNPDDPHYSFFKSFKNEQKLYDVPKLLIVAMLIGKGSQQEKAEWLFRVYDADASGMMDKEELSNMISTLFEVSTEITPPLAIGTGPDNLTEEQLNAYMDPIKAKKDQIIETTVTSILTEENISQNEFIVKMNDSGQKAYFLSSASGIRYLGVDN